MINICYFIYSIGSNLFQQRNALCYKWTTREWRYSSIWWA